MLAFDIIAQHKPLEEFVNDCISIARNEGYDELYTYIRHERYLGESETINAAHHILTLVSMGIHSLNFESILLYWNDGIQSEVHESFESANKRLSSLGDSGYGIYSKAHNIVYIYKGAPVRKNVHYAVNKLYHENTYTYKLVEY
jgi:hypothetical protein